MVSRWCHVAMRRQDIYLAIVSVFISSAWPHNRHCSWPWMSQRSMEKPEREGKPKEEASNSREATTITHETRVCQTQHKNFVCAVQNEWSFQMFAMKLNKQWKRTKCSSHSQKCQKVTGHMSDNKYIYHGPHTEFPLVDDSWVTSCCSSSTPLLHVVTHVTLSLDNWPHQLSYQLRRFNIYAKIPLICSPPKNLLSWSPPHPSFFALSRWVHVGSHLREQINGGVPFKEKKTETVPCALTVQQECPFTEDEPSAAHQGLKKLQPLQHQVLRSHW